MRKARVSYFNGHADRGWIIDEGGHVFALLGAELRRAGIGSISPGDVLFMDPGTDARGEPVARELRLIERAVFLPGRRQTVGIGRGAA